MTDRYIDYESAVLIQLLHVTNYFVVVVVVFVVAVAFLFVPTAGSL